MSGSYALGKYLLSAHCLPGTVLGAKDRMVGKTHKDPCLAIAYIEVEDSDENGVKRNHTVY